MLPYCIALTHTSNDKVQWSAARDHPGIRAEPNVLNIMLRSQNVRNPVVNYNGWLGLKADVPAFRTLTDVFNSLLDNGVHEIYALDCKPLNFLADSRSSERLR